MTASLDKPRGKDILLRGSFAGGTLLNAYVTTRSENPRLPEGYERAIAEALDETLERALGTTVKEVVYSYICDEYNLSLETFHSGLEQIVKALKRVIGENASIIIEKVVVKKLCSSLSLKGVDEDCSLLDLIGRLKDLKEKDLTRIGKEV